MEKFALLNLLNALNSLTAKPAADSTDNGTQAAGNFAAGNVQSNGAAPAAGAGHATTAGAANAPAAYISERYGVRAGEARGYIQPR